MQINHPSLEELKGQISRGEYCGLASVAASPGLFSSQEQNQLLILLLTTVRQQANQEGSERSLLLDATFSFLKGRAADVERRDGDELLDSLYAQLKLLETHIEACPTKEDRQLLLFLLAQASYREAQYSSEPCDWNRCLTLCNQLYKEGCLLPSLYNLTADILLRQSELLNREDLLFKAVEFYEQASALEPDNPLYPFNLGCLYLQQFKVSHSITFFQMADSFFHKCHQLGIESSKFYQLRSEAALLQAKISFDPDLAARACNYLEVASLLLEEPETLSLDLAEAYLWKARLQEDYASLQCAQNYLLSVPAKEPDQTRQRLLRAELALERGLYFGEQDWFKKATEEYCELILCHRESIEAWSGLASALSHMVNSKSPSHIFSAASSCFEQALEYCSRPTPQFWNDWGLVALKAADTLNDKGWVHIALEKFTLAIQFDYENNDKASVAAEFICNYCSALDLLGDLTSESGCYVQSIELLEKVFEQSESPEQVSFYLAQALCHWGEAEADPVALERSCSLFSALAESDSEDEQLYCEWGVALTNLALLYHEPASPKASQDCYVKAEEKFFKALSLGFEQAHYHLACLYALRGDEAAALSHLWQAFERAALPSVEELNNDEWLHRLSGNQEFDQFLLTLQGEEGE